MISDSISSWTFRGFEGKPVVVEVYSPGDQVELFLNGISLGTRAAGKSVGFITTFETSYAPGVLEAVAYENGTVLGKMRLDTADHSTRQLCITPEIGRELIFVPVLLADAKHTVITDESCTLTCHVSGDAALLGWGSGDPKPKYNYTGAVTDTFYGRALAVLKKRTNSGQAAFSVRNHELHAELSIDW